MREKECILFPLQKMGQNWAYYVPATNYHTKNGHELAKSRAVKMYSQFVTNCPWCKLVSCDQFTAAEIVVPTHYPTNIFISLPLSDRQATATSMYGFEPNLWSISCLDAANLSPAKPINTLAVDI